MAALFEYIILLSAYYLINPVWDLFYSFGGSEANILSTSSSVRE